MVVLIVYVDDTFVYDSYICGIEQVKLQQLRYFLGIEVACSKKRLVLSQRKYVQD